MKEPESSLSDNKVLRVLQLSRWIGIQGGGVQTYIQSLSEALSVNRIQLRYAGLMYGSVPPYANDALTWTGLKGRSKWRNAFALYQWLKIALRDTDIVHIHGVTDWHFLVGVLACRVSNTPYVVSLHGSLMPAAMKQIGLPAKGMAMLARPMLRQLLRGAAAVIASSPTESRLIKLLHHDIETRILPLGLKCPPLSSAEDEACSELHVLYLGRVEPRKSLATLFRAMLRLREQGKTVFLEVAGEDFYPYTRQMRAMVKKLGLEAQVNWRGYLSGDSKWRALRDAHVLVLPSLEESFGYAAAEAMGLGVPVVVSDGVGLSELTKQYDAGSVFAVGDDRELAGCLLDYFDLEFRQNKAANANLCWRQALSLDIMGNAMDSLYRDTVRYC